VVGLGERSVDRRAGDGRRPGGSRSSPGFATTPEVEHAARLDAVIGLVGQRTTEEVLAFAEHRRPSPDQSIADIFQDPHYEARDDHGVEHPTLGPLKMRT
jgi:hypothetical protein